MVTAPDMIPAEFRTHRDAKNLVCRARRSRVWPRRAKWTIGPTHAAPSIRLRSLSRKLTAGGFHGDGAIPWHPIDHPKGHDWAQRYPLVVER
jgi:hypothetical protein